MKNTKNIYLKKETKKDNEIKKCKRINKILLISLIIFAVLLFSQMAQDMLKMVLGIKQVSDDDKRIITTVTTNETNLTQAQTCYEPSISSSISKGIISFMDKLFSYPGGFWTKFFIFLGIIYFIQVTISMAFDIIELILLTGNAIIRLIVWIYRKSTGKDKYDAKLKKIIELYEEKECRTKNKKRMRIDGKLLEG